MAWRVRWAKPAVDSVERQAAYIAADSPLYAAALIREARDAARSLRQFTVQGCSRTHWTNKVLSGAI